MSASQSLEENSNHKYFYREAQKEWFRFLKTDKAIYSLGIFFVLLTAFLQVMATRIVGWVLDFFTADELPAFFQRADKEATFMWIFSVLVISRFALFIARVGWRMTLARQTHKASSVLKTNLWDNVRFFRHEDLVRRFTKGVLMNANTSDVSTGRYIYGFTLVAIFDMVFLGVFTLGTMISINPKLTALSLGVLILLPFFVKKLSSLEMIRYREAQEDLGEFNDLTSQVVSTIRLQRVNQTGKFWTNRLEDSAESYRQKRLKAIFTSLRYIPVMGSGHVLAYGALFFAGIPFVINGTISVGDFVSMQGLIFLLQDPLAELGFIISEWKKSFTSLGRLSEIYKHDKDPHLTPDGKNLDENPVILSAQDISFKYFDGEDYVIKDFSYELRKGGRLGITGPIGSGKSTLIKILSGLERGIEGDLSFLHHPFKDYSHPFLRSFIGIVPQKPFLFADTIRENVRLDRPLTDEEVWKFLELAGLDKDVKNFPDKLDTPLGEWGINLSGGQKQRLTLARALARQCQLYFFDDCLSAVDTVTEEKILSNLNTYLKDQTLVWVAHRNSTLRHCDDILEIKP